VSTTLKPRTQHRVRHHCQSQRAGIMSDPSIVSSNNDDRLSLPKAMQVADVIRKHMEARSLETTPSSSSTESSSFRFPVPPGVVEGIAVAVATGCLLLPVRRLALTSAGKRLLVFTDLVVTPVQCTVAASAGLYATSLYGSREYLRQLARVPPTAPSETAWAICQEVLSRTSQPQDEDDATELTNLDASIPDGAASWDPRVQTLQALQKALVSCEQRQQYQTSLVEEDQGYFN
jgi:hypothetical protein